ncbi:MULTISPECIES: hypothetical protein [unclassified Nostoc]|uniref:hypothetical protein n=1 Tax=unclassified Nostoc TaxID=2593658 RepID=UPI002AD525B5|nr:hypothetical protein [Nostoc sp. DedQUE03]MDZ7975540.1 hypothetical protein [Nostoc sp. DedQUE03]MDZ8045594.1 hypothetical protein [Nostoc sp. DedQUE02]
MPTQRIIKSTFIGLNNEPLRNAVVQVIHMQGNTIDNIEYPQVTKNFITNREGKINFILWCNEEGERSSFYRFVLPGGETFDAIVPVGTSDLELSVLREGGGDSSAPQHQSLITYILNEIGGTLTPATSTVAGIVKTNSTSTNPVVYLKSEVDTLLNNVAGFDLTNYYTKPQSDTLLNTKADKSTTYTKAQTDALVGGVTVDLSGYYTKPQTDGLVAPKANSSDVATALSLKANTSDVNTSLATKANQSTTYTKTEVDGLVSPKANQSTTYTKTEVDNLVATKDTLVELTDVVISSPSNTQVLAYNSTTSKWTNQTLSAGGTGETNTASNVGVSGVGVFKQKTGANLEFKNINAGSSKISITNDTANSEIDIDVNEANLTLGNLAGTLAIAKGGTGSTTASAALTALGGATSTSLTTHTSDTSNPHGTTAAQVGSATAQWNANKLQGIAISSTAPTNTQTLVYNSTTSSYEPSNRIGDHPGYRSGLWYSAMSQTDGLTAITTASTANTISYHPFSITKPITISKMSINQATSTTGLFRFGVYSNNSTTFLPETLLLKTIELNAAGTIERGDNVSYTFNPGWYWFAITSNVSLSISGESALASIMYYIGRVTFGVSNLVYGYRNPLSYSSGSLPTTAPLDTLTEITAGLPFLFFKAA